MKNEELWERREREILENPKGVVWKVIKWILGLGIGLSLLFWALGLIFTPLKTGKDIIQKTLNADNVLQNYEWFKQQNQDYQAIQIKIIESDSSIIRFIRSAGPRMNWTFEDKNEYSRLQSISDGLRYQMADIAGKYNARSQMLNRELFKTSDLPYVLKY